MKIPGDYAQFDIFGEQAFSTNRRYTIEEISGLEMDIL